MYLDYKRTYAELSSASFSRNKGQWHRAVLDETRVSDNKLTITLVAFVVGHIYIKQQCRRCYYHSCLPSCLPYKVSHVPAAQIWSEVALTAHFLYPIHNCTLKSQSHQDFLCKIRSSTKLGLIPWYFNQRIIFFNIFEGHQSFLWFGLLVISALGFKTREDSSLACFVACVQWIPEIHLWCDACWSLGG